MGASVIEGTVGEFIAWIAPSLDREKPPPSWPPDVFAIAASLLHRTGAYTHVVDEWPPARNYAQDQEWSDFIRKIGRDWRENTSSPPTGELLRLWQVLTKNWDLPISETHRNHVLTKALLELCAAADEACAGVGVSSDEVEGNFERAIEYQLITSNRRNGVTLCRSIHSSKLRVLPKQHAPRSGITIRSISHHLALCISGDVAPHWSVAKSNPEAHSLNLLVVPFPKSVLPSQFSPAEPSCGKLDNMDSEKFGFFKFTLVRPEEDISETVLNMRRKGIDAVGRIDGVVMPEACISRDEYEKLRDCLIKEKCFLVTGVWEPPANSSEPGKNYVASAFPLHDKDGVVQFTQCKHHRWRLDKSQICQYGLGAQLDPTREWWEHILLEDRTVEFVTIRDWLTLCILICEDLARPDPIGDIVRAVGPNLVIALLMDGPQLASRWSARYATVLADDPGSSVLSVTSLGMVSLSTPPAGVSPSRVVALWKDARTRDAIQLDMPKEKTGVVLSLTRETSNEVTADGRSDEGTTFYPVLSGTYFI